MVQAFPCAHSTAANKTKTKLATTEDMRDTEVKPVFSNVISVSSVPPWWRAFSIPLLLDQLAAHHAAGIERRVHVEVEAGRVVENRLRRGRRHRDADARERARAARQDNFAGVDRGVDQDWTGHARHARVDVRDVDDGR